MPIIALLLALSLTGPAMVTRDGDALRLWQALNAERLGQGVAALTLDPTLSRVAWKHAADLAARDTVDHLSSDGLGPFDRMRLADIRFGYAGENIALDFDVLHADRALWNSAPHRRNTLEPHYQRIGVAAVATDRGEFFVEDFSD